MPAFKDLIDKETHAKQALINEPLSFNDVLGCISLELGKRFRTKLAVHTNRRYKFYIVLQESFLFPAEKKPGYCCCRIIRCKFRLSTECSAFCSLIWIKMLYKKSRQVRCNRVHTCRLTAPVFYRMLTPAVLHVACVCVGSRMTRQSWAKYIAELRLRFFWNRVLSCVIVAGVSGWVIMEIIPHRKKFHFLPTLNFRFSAIGTLFISYVRVSLYLNQYFV